MGSRGPLKLPTHLRPVAGSDKAGTAAEMVKPIAPVKPEAVADNDALSELWDVIVPRLDEAGLVAASDAPVIELALRHFLAARRASDSLSSGPEMVHDEKNQRPMKNPSEPIFRSQSAMFLEYAKQIGMTFVARARTPVRDASDGGEKDNPFAATGS